MDNSAENPKKLLSSQISSTVIHRHNDGREKAAGWRKHIASAIIDPSKKVSRYGSQIHRRTGK